MRFLKMNLTRLPSTERINVQYVHEWNERWIELYARVRRKLCKLEQIVRDDLWPVRVLKGQRKIRMLTA